VFVLFFILQTEVLPMKLATLVRILEDALPLLACPRCGQPFSLAGTSLKCTSNHCYDLCAKGYVNLAPQHDQSREKYDAALFESRSVVLESGFYAPVLTAISDMLKKHFGDSPFSLLDAGCGEGYYARSIAGSFPGSRVMGVDLSRDGIRAAARKPGDVLWLVADLKQLPLADHSADVVLDVLTPASYDAFRRVLKPDGELIKVIPDSHYLAEIRSAFQPYLRQEGYSNQQVLEHLSKHAQILEQQEILETLPLTPEQAKAFLRMTPMGFSVPQDVLEKTVLKEITLHLQVVRCRLGKG